jgi:nicotinamide-nucleotide amidase
MSTDEGRLTSPHPTTHLAEALGSLCRQRGWSISTAESCTGGGIARAITDIPGSSDYFQGGIVAYSNALKQQLLRVSPGTLASVGAVSRECAQEMVLGARATLHTDVALASTGIAGPGGATARKPVGLVYLAVATPATIEVRELRLAGTRADIMDAATAAALELALTVLGADAPEKETTAS